VVLALAKIGIVEVSALKAGRRYVYFAMSIVAAVITPGDVITATVALMVPLILLYELGILLARFVPNRARPPATASRPTCRLRLRRASFLPLTPCARWASFGFPD